MPSGGVLSTSRSLRRACALLGATLASAAAAQSGATKSARDEVERQLREMVAKPPTRVKVTFAGLDEPGYKVEEALISLDGAPLSTPGGAVLSQEGEHAVFQGDYPPGDHKLDAKVTIADAAGVMLSYEAGYKWKVAVARTFTLQPGLEVHVVLRPVRNPDARDPRQKFKLTSTATPRMLAVLDDGSMPEPLANKAVAVAAVDAGAPQTEAERGAEARRLAVAEKTRLAEEAKAAKLAAAEEKKRLAEEARAAKLAAVEEKKRLAEEARAARLVAASGVAPPVAAPTPSPAVGAAPPELDAGAEVAEIVDAVAPVAVAEGPPASKAVPAQPEAEDDTPWGLILGLGVAVLAVALLLLMRGRSNPRDPGV